MNLTESEPQTIHNECRWDLCVYNHVNLPTT